MAVPVDQRAQSAHADRMTWWNLAQPTGGLDAPEPNWLLTVDEGEPARDDPGLDDEERE